MEEGSIKTVLNPIAAKENVNSNWTILFESVQWWLSYQFYKLQLYFMNATQYQGIV